jgi:hypothetical protein
MSDLDNQIKDIEEHIALKLSGANENLLDTLDISLDKSPHPLDLMKDLFKQFGPVPRFNKLYSSYLKKLHDKRDSYLTDFYKSTGVKSGGVQFTSERKIKGINGKVRPSRRRLNSKFAGQDFWNLQITDYISHINFKNYHGKGIEDLKFELSQGTFSPLVESLMDLTVEDILQHVSLNVRDMDDIVTAGFAGARTEEYGGDVYYNLSFSPDRTVPSGERLVNSCFNKYQFDISCLVSSITLSSKFDINDFEPYGLGLDPNKKYFLGSFICIATRHFNSFSSMAPSPFVYIKPIVVLFEEDGWVHYNQTKWVEVPHMFFHTCYDMVAETMYKEYAS